MFFITTTTDASQLPDEEILMRSQQEPWVFAILLERYEAPFLRKALTVVYNPLDAEEVVQDAFTKIYIHAHTFTPQVDAKFSSWAYRILLNTAFTRYQKLRKEGERTIAIHPEAEAFLSDQSQHKEGRERQDAIERILARLPGHFAEVLRLHYLERWSHEDIGKRTNEKVGTIKARIHRAKIAFRKASKEGEAELLH